MFRVVFPKTVMRMRFLFSFRLVLYLFDFFALSIQNNNAHFLSTEQKEIHIKTIQYMESQLFLESFKKYVRKSLKFRFTTLT